MKKIKKNKVKKKIIRAIASSRNHVPDHTHLFDYGRDFWREKITEAEGEEKLAVAGLFIDKALDAFCVGTDKFTDTPKAQTRLLSLLARHAERLADASKDIIQDYKLERNWFKTVLVQLVVEGAGEGVARDKSIKRLKRVFKANGWFDLQECLNPSFDELRTTLPVKYPDGKGGLLELKVILRPAVPAPVGSKWRAGNGSEWEVVELKGDSVHCLPEIPPYHEKVFGLAQVLKWERLL